MAEDQGHEHLATLLERIEAKTAVIGIMGMGYVGLPLAATFHRAGFQASSCVRERAFGSGRRDSDRERQGRGGVVSKEGKGVNRRR